MTSATNYSENAIAESLLRGTAFPLPNATYVALHTADPGDTGEASEVTASLWPGYARVDAARGGSVDEGWTPADSGLCRNAKQLVYPVYDGTGDITVTHFSVKNAATGGDSLVHAPLNASRTLRPGDVFVIDVEKLTVQVL